MFNWKYFLQIAIVLFLWASSYVAIRHSLEVFTAENLAFLRYLSASVGFVIASLFTKIRKPSMSDMLHIILLGLTGFTIYNLLLNYGERTVNAGIASFIINTVPFFTLLLVFFKKEEKIKYTDWIGMCIAFTGVIVIILTKDNNISFDSNTFFILGAAFCQAFYFSMQKNLLKKYSPIELTSYAVWSGTVILFFFSDKPFEALINSDKEHLFSVLYLGIFPGMIAYLIIANALSTYKTTNISSYLFLIPFITLLLSWLSLNEVPSMWAIAGGILIVIGILVKNIKKRSCKD